MEVVIVDSGGANLASLRFALERLGARAEVTHGRAQDRAAPSGSLLPGVGAAAPRHAAPAHRGTDRGLRTLTQPVLGVCLGMQLLFERSEEGDDRVPGCPARHGAQPESGARPSRAAHGLEHAAAPQVRSAARGRRGRATTPTSCTATPPR